MQDTKEQINYDDYQIVFDGQLMGIGGSEHGDLIAFYKVVIKFASVEIIEKRRDWAELEKYFDFNLTLSANPYEFLCYIFENYYRFYTNNIEYIDLLGSLKTGVQLRITKKAIEWFAIQMEDETIKTYSDDATGCQLREYYAKIRPQITPTLSAIEEIAISTEVTPTLSLIEERAITTPLLSSSIDQERDEPKISNITLISFFTEPSKYPIILKLLSDRNYSYPNSNVWNTRKGFLIRVLKNLYLKNYFKRKPTNQEYEAIALNTFGCILGIDTIKKTQSKVTETDLDFIPFPTTI